MKGKSEPHKILKINYKETRKPPRKRKKLKRKLPSLRALGALGTVSTAHCLLSRFTFCNDKDAFGFTFESNKNKNKNKGHVSLPILKTVFCA